METLLRQLGAARSARLDERRNEHAALMQPLDLDLNLVRVDVQLAGDRPEVDCLVRRATNETQDGHVQLLAFAGAGAARFGPGSFRSARRSGTCSPLPGGSGGRTPRGRGATGGLL